MSRQRLAETYDRSYQASLRALASVPATDFNKHLDYPLWDPLLTGEVTVEYLFGYIKRHFDSHAAQVENVIQNQ